MLLVRFDSCKWLQNEIAVSATPNLLFFPGNFYWRWEEKKGKEGKAGEVLCLEWDTTQHCKPKRTDPLSCHLRSGELWAFLRLQTLLSILSLDSFIKTQDFFFTFPPAFPVVHHCPNAMFCQVMDAFFCIYLLCVQTGHWKCSGMSMPDPVDVNRELLRSSSITAAPCHTAEPQVPPWASVFNLLVKVKAHFWLIGHTEKRRRMFCPGFFCILTFTLPQHKLLMFKYITLFTSSFQELPDYLQISLLSNLPL